MPVSVHPRTSVFKRSESSKEELVMRRGLLLLAPICIVPVLLAVSPSADGAPAAGEAMVLWPDGAPGAVGNEPADVPTLTPYWPPAQEATGAAVVVCPGGGYGHLADHEGRPVAEWLNSIGVAGFVLKYRIAPRYKHPAPLQDASRAIRTVRANAKEWDLDPTRIGILGFSAGGHLASTAGTHFDAGKSDSSDPIERVSSRPDAMVLVYPVITMGEFTHQGSKRNLLGKDPSDDLVALLSNEKQVTEKTPPTFLIHTVQDRGVPYENSLLFAAALRKHGVPHELHLYERGHHGFGLGTNDPILASWPRRCADWLRLHGFAAGN
jgi:acetyl esterase/lipase